MDNSDALSTTDSGYGSSVRSYGSWRIIRRIGPDYSQTSKHKIEVEFNEIVPRSPDDIQKKHSLPTLFENKKVE